MPDYRKKRGYYLLRMTMLGTAAYAIGALIACFLYLLFAIATGKGDKLVGIFLLLMLGTVGAFVGGLLLYGFLGHVLTLRGENQVRFGLISGLIEAVGLAVGALILFFIVTGLGEASGPGELIAFSVLGLLGVTVIDAVHGGLLAGLVFQDKPAGYFAKLSAGMALTCGMVIGLPYLWVMSGLPMSYRGVEYQMLVPVLITVISLGTTMGFSIGSKRQEPSS